MFNVKKTQSRKCVAYHTKIKIYIVKINHLLFPGWLLIKKKKNKSMGNIFSTGKLFIAFIPFKLIIQQRIHYSLKTSQNSGMGWQKKYGIYFGDADLDLRGSMNQACVAVVVEQHSFTNFKIRGIKMNIEKT